LSWNFKQPVLVAVLVASGIAAAFANAVFQVSPVHAQAMATGPGHTAHASNEAGKVVYREANCVGCHKWHGGGGGGYGGAALSLRATHLTREQIIEVVRCGRPNTGMPHFVRDAYAADGCYGLTAADLGPAIPGAGVRFLRAQDIEAVADYVLTAIKGKDEPNYADCSAFFGEPSRMCQSFKDARAGGSARAMPNPTTSAQGH